MAGDMGNSDEPISAINVTPFVDITLVLLVIFLVTAPALMKDTIGIQLPKASSGDAKVLPTMGIAITKQGQILVNGELTPENLLPELARKAVLENPSIRAVIGADQDSRHGDVIHVIDLIKTAGLTNFAIQIQR